MRTYTLFACSILHRSLSAQNFFNSQLEIFLGEYQSIESSLAFPGALVIKFMIKKEKSRSLAAKVFPQAHFFIWYPFLPLAFTIKKGLTKLIFFLKGSQCPIHIPFLVLEGDQSYHITYTYIIVIITRHLFISTIFVSVYSSSPTRWTRI